MLSTLTYTYLLLVEMEFSQILVLQPRGKCHNLSYWELSTLSFKMKSAAFILEDTISLKLDNNIPPIKWFLVRLTRNIQEQEQNSHKFPF